MAWLTMSRKSIHWKSEKEEPELLVVANSSLSLAYGSSIHIVFLLGKLETVTYLVITMTDNYVCILKTSKKE